MRNTHLCYKSVSTEHPTHSAMKHGGAIAFATAALLWTLAFVASLWRYVGSPIYGQIISAPNPQNATDLNDSPILSSGDAVLVLWSISGTGILCIQLALKLQKKPPFAAIYVVASLCASCVILQLLIGGADLALLCMSVAKNSSFQFDTMYVFTPPFAQLIQYNSHTFNRPFLFISGYHALRCYL